MFDLVLQCTPNGNHAFQMHLQHEKNDNSGQCKTLSCVHPVCNGFFTTTNNRSSQEYCCVTTGASGIKTLFTGVNRSLQSIRKSWGVQDYAVHGKGFDHLLFQVCTLLQGGSGSGVFHSLLAPIASTPPLQPCATDEISGKNVNLWFYNMNLDKVVCIRMAIYIETLEYFLEEISLLPLQSLNAKVQRKDEGFSWYFQWYQWQRLTYRNVLMSSGCLSWGKLWHLTQTDFSHQTSGSCQSSPSSTEGTAPEFKTLHFLCIGTTEIPAANHPHTAGTVELERPQHVPVSPTFLANMMDNFSLWQT